MHFHDNTLVTDGVVPLIEAVQGQESLRAHDNKFVDALGTSKFIWHEQLCGLNELKESSGLSWGHF